jgi:hypothetical protein
MASNQCPPPNPFLAKMIFQSSLFMSFYARFKRHLLRDVPMLMQYLPTTATACCFSTLPIHSFMFRRLYLQNPQCSLRHLRLYKERENYAILVPAMILHFTLALLLFFTSHL